jgi:hypothetical protein
MAFIPDAPSKFVPDTPDPIGAANHEANAQEHGPVQDIIDMLKGVPSGILPAIHGAISGLTNPFGAAINAAQSVHGVITNPDAALSAVKNATPDQIGRNVVAPLAVGAVGGKVGGLAADALDPATTAANAPAAVRNLGMRTAVDHPIARNVAGSSGREALTAQNQSIADPTAGAVAGVPHGTAVNAQTLEAAREAPNSVYQRAAEHIPTGPLSPNAAQAVQGIGADDLVVHSPDTQATIEAQKQRLLAAPMSGNQVVDTQRALRFNGFRNAASEDPEMNAVGGAQLKMADALHQHMADTLPANAPVSADQLAQARQALAQNHTVESTLKNGNVDMQALARIHRNNPNLLSGPLKDMAEFGDLHPEVTSLPGVNARYNPSGVIKDVKDFDVVHPVGAVARMFGGSVARRALLGSPEAAAAAQTATPVRGLGGEFGPIDRTPQPPPGLTASPPSAPPAPAAGPPDQISLADLLSHGVEQSPTEGLSLAPEAPPAQGGIPFKVNAEHAAGDLSLADQLSPFKGKPQSMADFAGVKSQGVPEGIVQRSPSSRTKGTMDTIDFPSGAQHPSFQNNASGESAASLEAQSRLKGEKAAGTRPVMVGPDGDEQPLLHDVTAVDQSPQKGGIILDAKTGKVINSGNMKPAAAQALVNRWKARRPIGEQF